MHKIAEHFSLEAREKAATRAYFWIEAGSGLVVHTTKDGCCPLGVMLAHDDKRSSLTEYIPPAPTARCVADALAGLRSPEFSAVEREAEAFMNDWDAGKISDLRETLGVPVLYERVEDRRVQDR